MVTLVVEDGTGKTTSNVYISQADANTYLTDYSHTVSGGGDVWDAATSAAKDLALVAGAEYMELRYKAYWKGVRANETQAMEWPRSGVENFAGNAIDEDALPVLVARANAYAAFLHLSETGGLLATIDEPGSKTYERVKVGPIETEDRYETGGKGQVKWFRKLDKLVAEYLVPANTMGRA